MKKRVDYGVMNDGVHISYKSRKAALTDVMEMIKDGKSTDDITVVEVDKKTGQEVREITDYQELIIRDLLKRVNEEYKAPIRELLPKKINGADLCAVREDFGWWVGYDCKDLSKEISATGKTLEEAFNKLNDYWFKSGKLGER